MNCVSVDPYLRVCVNAEVLRLLTIRGGDLEHGILGRQFRKDGDL